MSTSSRVCARWTKDSFTSWHHCTFLHPRNMSRDTTLMSTDEYPYLVQKQGKLTTTTCGTDKNDQMTRLQKYRRHYKWPRRLIMKFFMWVIYNAYVLMNFVKPHAQSGCRLFTFHAFLEKLFAELVGDVRNDFNSSFSSRRLENVLVENRLRRDVHHEVLRPDSTCQNNRCAVCRKIYLMAKKAYPEALDRDLAKTTKNSLQMQILRWIFMHWWRKQQSLVWLA